MTKEELEKYAHENRKRLDAQEVKIGDVVKVLRGQFAGETGVVVGIIACIGDYTDPYYEVDMDCEVPDKNKCRKSILAPNNVIGGLSADEFEVIGNRIPSQPTSPTIKVGDRVCCYNAFHLKGPKKEDYMGYVASITDMGIMIQLDKGGLVRVYHESDLELVKPKEQTEAEKTDTDNLKKIAEEWANEVSNAIEEFGDAMCKIHIEAQNEAYWDAYTADLAKEIALKVANKYSDPTEAADYAVSVAKAVVENLKKK